MLKLYVFGDQTQLYILELNRSEYILL